VTRPRPILDARSPESVTYALEVHAERRLTQRYDIPSSRAREVMFHHIALTLADEGERVRCKGAKLGTKEFRLLNDGGTEFAFLYWPGAQRIITYLTPATMTDALHKAYIKHMRQRRKEQR